MPKKSKKSKEKGDNELMTSTKNVNFNKGESAVYAAVPDTDTDTSVAEVKAPARIPSRKKKKQKRKNKNDDDDDDFQSDDDGNRLERKPSPVVAPLPTLTNAEYAIFEMVKEGDVDGVTEALGNMNINKANKDGYTLLHLAVKRQDEAMVNLLLSQPGIQMYDTILHAIREDNLGITELLLEVYDKTSSEEKKQLFMSSLSVRGNDDITTAVATSGGMQVFSSPISPKSGVRSSIKNVMLRGSKQGSPRSNIQSTSTLLQEDGDGEGPFDSEFSPTITPLMLAAQVESYEMMDFFYKRNERLESTEYHHNNGCECDICVKLEGDEDLTRALQRYQLFDALSRPQYICFIARKEKIDPVNYAFQKILKLRHITERDTGFESDKKYSKYVERLETFTTELAGLCRTTLESEIFLSPMGPDEKERLPHLHPRLWYAVGFQLKKFVAHPNIQNVVYRAWATDDWPDWDSYGTLYKAFNLVIRIIGFPIIALILLLASNTPIGRVLGSPVSRFLTFIASYLVFLGLLGVQTLFPYQRCNNEPPYYQTDDESCHQRGPPHIGTEWPIILYVLSFYVSTMKKNSVSWYWSVKWNWVELLCLLCFTASFISWLWAWVWTQLPENEDFIFATERLMWPHNCAEVWGECFLSVAAILAFGRLLPYMLVFPVAGPIIIGLGTQITGFISAGLVYSSVLLGFASGLLALYVPYKDFMGQGEDGKMKKQDGTFTEIASTMGNLFWYLYEAGGSESTTLLTWPADNETEGAEDIHHDYTEYTGNILYACYHVIGSMMMFSMLGGYFTKAIGELQNDIDPHWKFARTEMYLTFIKDTMLPPPFNLFPTLHGIGEGVRFMKSIGKKQDPKAACSCKQCCYITTGTSKKDRWSKLVKKYRKLIVELMYRYGNFKDEEAGGSPATKDDVLEIGEELAEIKSMLQSKAGGTQDDDSSSEDDFKPSGGGVMAKASKKKGWSKAKMVVDASGATYLKNVVSKAVSGSPVTTQPKASEQQPVVSASRRSSKEQPKKTPSITTVYEAAQQQSSKVTVPSSLQSTPTKGPALSPTKTQSPGGVATNPTTNRNFPQQAGGGTPNKTKSAPIETATPASLARPVSQRGGKAPMPPPPLPNPIPIMTTDDSEGTGTVDQRAPPSKANPLSRTFSKAKK